MITAKEAIFSESEPGVFTRKLTGNEAICSLASMGGGWTHMTLSTNVKFLKQVSRDELREKVTHAMIRLRHLFPAIAYSISMLLPKQEFQFRYKVPESLEEATEWATSVVKLHEEQMSFEDAQAKISETVWWKGSDGRYTHELHLHPSPGEDTRWTFTLSAMHGNADGRCSWMVFEKLFLFLQDDILMQASSLEDLKWGEETRRLSAPTESIPSIAKNGEPDDFPDVGGDYMPKPPDGYVPFLYPIKEIDGVEDGVLAARIVFSKEDTVRLRRACKKKGRTVTQAITALTGITIVECILKIAAESANKEKDNFYEEAVAIFEKSTHFQTGPNATDARVLLPEGYKSLSAEHSTPTNAVESFPLSFPFTPYRKLVSVDKGKHSVSCTKDSSIFWNELVEGVAEAWKNRPHTLESHRASAALLTKMSTDPFIDRGAIPGQAPFYSSCGDLSRLGILEDFRPSVAKALMVDGLDCSVRSLNPGLQFTFVEYDGVFNFLIATNKKYWTKEQLNLFTTLLKGWFDVTMSET